MALKSFRFEQENYGEKILKDIGTLFNFLNKSDHKQLSDYLISPFFNVNEQCVELYDYLLPLHKRGTKKTNVEVLLLKWTKENEKTKYDISHLLKKAKHLYQHILDFLAHQKIRDHEKDKLQVLQKRLRNKGVSKSFEEVSQKLYNLVSSEPIGLDRLFDEFQLCHLAYFENDMDHEQNGLAFFNVLNKKRVRLLTTIKAAYACEENNLKHAASLKKETSSSAIFSDKKNKIDLKKFYQLALIIAQPWNEFSKDKLDEFSNNFLKKHNQISLEDRLILCKHISNSISRGRNNNFSDLSKVSYEWLRRRVEWSLLPLNKVDKNEYLNIVNTALLNNDIKFAEYYIHKYTPVLPEAHNDKAYYLALAYCLFYNKYFDETIELLRRHFPPHFDSHFYCIILRAKSLFIKTYAEKIFLNDNIEEQLDLFENATKAFYKYLHRSHKKTIIPKLYIERYTNFLSVIKKLVATPYFILSRKDKRKKIKEHLMLLNESKPVISFNWFECKIRANLKVE